MSVEVGTPTYILQYLTSKGIPASTVGLIVAVYWLMMLIGRFVGASIGGKGFQPHDDHYRRKRHSSVSEFRYVLT